MSPRELGDILPSADAEELIDFTCVTPWERLVLDVELKLRDWHLDQTASQCDAAISEAEPKARSTQVCLSARPLLLEHVRRSDQHIAAILGVDECVVLGPVDFQSDAAVDASDAAVLLSALTSAASACGCCLPMIVRVGRVDALRMIGRQGGSHPRRFCCDYTSYPSGPSTQLSAILHLFHNKRVATRRLLPPSRGDASICATFTYYWSDFSFAVTAAPDSFASDPALAQIHRPVLASSDPVPYLMLYVEWSPFHASQILSSNVAAPATSPVAGLTTRDAVAFRLAPPRDTFLPSAFIPPSFLPLTNYVRAFVRLIHSAALKLSRNRPAAPRSLVDIHVAASEGTALDHPTNHSRASTRLVETRSAPSLRNSSSRFIQSTAPVDSSRPESGYAPSASLGPPPNAMDNFLAQISDYTSAAAVEDEKLDEDFLVGAVASLFGLEDNRGLISDVVEALGPGVSEMSAAERISRLIAASGSVSMAIRLWGLFLDGVDLHWQKRWILGGVPFDSKVGPAMGECLIVQKLEMLNCCVVRLHQSERQTRSETGFGAGTSASLGRKMRLWPYENHAAVETRGDGSQGSPAEDDGTDESASQDGYMWEPFVQPLPYVTRDIVEAEQRKIMRNASVGGSGGGKSAAEIKQQSSALKSDMMSFKAANPAATMSDFVRWFSPSDWVEEDSDDGAPVPAHRDGVKPPSSQVGITLPKYDAREADSTDPSAQDTEPCIAPSTSGRLSQRMRAPGNLWQELWDSVTPTPASEQVPLFDAHMHGLKALTDLRAMPLKEVLRQFACVQAKYAVRVLQVAFERPPLLPSIIAAVANARQSGVACQAASPEDDAESLASIADVCDKLATAEHMALGASSLVTKLPPGAEFAPVINALVSGEKIDVGSERERAALSLVAGMEEDGWRSPLLPSYREYVLQGSDGDRMQARVSTDMLRVGVRLEMEYSTS